MPNLLHLDSSMDTKHSRSRAVTKTFADTWRAAGAEHTVTYRDLHADPIGHLSDPALHWAPRLRAADASPNPAAEAFQQSLLDELVAADVLLIGAPLYNYTVPSTLKTWLDHIHVPGVTASFDSRTKPMSGRPAVIVTSRGASYDAGGPNEGWDHEVPVLQLLLGTALGMKLTVITTSLTLADTVTALAEQIPRSRAELAQAHDDARAAAELLVTVAG